MKRVLEARASGRTTRFALVFFSHVPFSALKIMKAFGVPGAVLFTLFGFNVFNENAHEPIETVELPSAVAVTANGVMQAWKSESIQSSMLIEDSVIFENECNFFNFSSSIGNEFCDAFSISRLPVSTIHTASNRALKCGAHANVECILSSEVGLMVPAVFVSDSTDSDGMRGIIAPRIIKLDNNDDDDDVAHVRVTSPSDSLATKTLIFKKTIKVEFMDNTKHLKVETFKDDAAFCLQLLRVAFSRDCWAAID